MTSFAKLRGEFSANWTTALVGWTGLGILSPWPERWTQAPSLLSAGELSAYAEERLVTASDPPKQALIIELLSLDLRTEPRQAVLDILNRLSDLDGGDPALELRKWRLLLLEILLQDIPQDAVDGLIALTEFWANFGFPSGSPHEVQGRENSISPSEYYQPENLVRLLRRHREWIEGERQRLKKSDA
jgi:hypothetical protein